MDAPAYSMLFLLHVAVSISSLKHIKSQHLPTLSLVIPYIEVSPKQEYLVDRINGELSMVAVNVCLDLCGCV